MKRAWIWLAVRGLVQATIITGGWFAVAVFSCVVQGPTLWKGLVAGMAVSYWATAHAHAVQSKAVYMTATTDVLDLAADAVKRGEEIDLGWLLYQQYATGARHLDPDWFPPLTGAAMKRHREIPAEQR